MAEETDINKLIETIRHDFDPKARLVATNMLWDITGKMSDEQLIATLNLPEAIDRLVLALADTNIKVRTMVAYFLLKLNQTKMLDVEANNRILAVQGSIGEIVSHDAKYNILGS